MLHPTMVMLLLAVIVGTFVVILYNKYSSESNIEDDARQGLINDATSEEISALQTQISTASSSLSEIDAQVTILETVSNGLARATSTGLSADQAGATLDTFINFNSGFNTSNPCVTYDSSTGTFTLEPNSVYLINISIFTKLWTSGSSDSNDTRWAEFVLVRGDGSYIGPKLIAQPITRDNQSNLSSIYSFSYRTGGVGSGSSFLTLKCVAIGNTGYSFTISKETRIDFVRLGATL